MSGNPAAYLWLALLIGLCIVVALLVGRKTNAALVLLGIIFTPIILLFLVWIGIAPN